MLDQRLGSPTMVVGGEDTVWGGEQMFIPHGFTQGFSILALPKKRVSSTDIAGPMRTGPHMGLSNAIINLSTDEVFGYAAISPSGGL